MNVPLPGEELQLGVGPETGTGYLRVGRVVKEAVLEKTGLPPTGGVLDVGCGSGRMARHFLDYIEPPGRYVGMDIQRPFIEWCNEHLGGANGAFEFYHQDIYNGGYNPGGKIRASEYRFPFEDGSFDAIILYSVFTHLLPEDAGNYMREVARLLKPGGRCYSTWYLLTRNAEVKYLLPNIREGQVGYGFPHLVETLEENGLGIEGYRLGRGNGGEGEIWQDLLWLRKAGEVPRRFPKEEPEIREPVDPSNFSGAVQTLDPVTDSLTVSRGDGSRLTVRFSGRTEVRAHGDPGERSDLRRGQRAHVIYVEDPSGGPDSATKIVVRGRPERKRIQGIIEAVDREAGVITLGVPDEGSISVSLEPDLIESVAVNQQWSDLENLKPGQVAGVYVVPSARVIEALDTDEE
ncbi:MAG: methyltransferase domain-containing protein [Rubrobacteraceae bacterium]